MVHAMHAMLAGLGADAWFEYVRTDANVTDAPSREDMSLVRCAQGWGGRGGGDPRFGDELPGYGNRARAGGLGRDRGRAGDCGGRARQAWYRRGPAP